MPHVHAHAPHELTEGHEAETPGHPDRIERWLELLAVVLLSLTTLATAWSGYQAARWSASSRRATRVRRRRASRPSSRRRRRTAADRRRAAVRRLAERERRPRPEARRHLRVPVSAPSSGRRSRPGALGPRHEPGRSPGAAVHARVPPGVRGAGQALDAQADALYEEGTNSKSNETTTSSRRSSSPPCCSSQGSRCGCCGARCGSRCSAWPPRC